MKIATVDYFNKRTILIGFVHFKYTDLYSIYNIFKFLNINYNFQPKIIHSDFDKEISSAIKKSEFFNNKIIHIKWWLHFIKALRENLNRLKLSTKFNIKEIKSFLNNIKIICFININNIKKKKQFIIENLEKYKKYNEFIKYLNSYLFNKIIAKFYKNKNLLDKMY